jgi:hypothetical protein
MIVISTFDALKVISRAFYNLFFQAFNQPVLRKYLLCLLDPKGRFRCVLSLSDLVKIM